LSQRRCHEAIESALERPCSVPFIEALGASAVSQPVTVINQNLQNGTIDAILIDSSAIRSFKLYEPAKYLTIGWMNSPTCSIYRK